MSSGIEFANKITKEIVDSLFFDVGSGKITKIEVEEITSAVNAKLVEYPGRDKPQITEWLIDRTTRAVANRLL